MTHSAGGQGEARTSAFTCEGRSIAIQQAVWTPQCPSAMIEYELSCRASTAAKQSTELSCRIVRISSLRPRRLKA